MFINILFLKKVTLQIGLFIQYNTLHILLWIELRPFQHPCVESLTPVWLCLGMEL